MRTDDLIINLHVPGVTITRTCMYTCKLHVLTLQVCPTQSLSHSPSPQQLTGRLIGCRLETGDGRGPGHS